MNTLIALVWLAVLHLIDPQGNERSMTIQYVDPHTFQGFTQEECEAFLAKTIADDPPGEGYTYIGRCQNDEPQPYPRQGT